MNSNTLLGNRRSCSIYSSRHSGLPAPCVLSKLGLLGGLSGKLIGPLFLARAGWLSSASFGLLFMTSTPGKNEANDTQNLGGSWKSPADLVDPGTGYGKKARPVAVGTWEFGKIAVEAAKDTLKNHGTALDALESGIYIPNDENREPIRHRIGSFWNAFSTTQVIMMRAGWHSQE